MRIFLSLFLFATLFSEAIYAQSGLSLEGSSHDSSLPIEVTSQTLNFDQEAQVAIFEGDAVAKQGDITLQADILTVRYNEETGEISELNGQGNVVYDNGVERAEAEEMYYAAETDLLELRGSVTMVQGQTVLSSNKMILDVTSNAAELTGNVRTRFVPRN